MKIKDLKTKASAYALKNALAYKGKAQQGAVISSLFNEGLKKNEVKKYSKDISKMIKDLRIALGLTQEQFAAKVGVTFSTVNRWENGKGKPSPLAVKQIGELQSLLHNDF